MLVDRQANNQVMCRKYFDKADAAPLCLSPFLRDLRTFTQKFMGTDNWWAGRGVAGAIKYT